MNRLLDHAERGWVVFCGAGVSMVAPTCLPSWWQLNEQVVAALAHQIEVFCGPQQAAAWAGIISARRDGGRFPPEYQAEVVSKHYGAAYFKVLQCLDSDEPNAVHLALAALAKSGHVRVIVTTNFDRLIELAFRRMGVPLDVHFRAEHFESLAARLDPGASPPAACQLLKLHGSVEDHDTLVDTLAQRMRGLSPAICDALRHYLRAHHWLFLGYSGADLEANPHYLCLEAELAHAVGFSWLVHGAASAPPAAVARISALYGERADTPRGVLPAWLLQTFGPLMAGGFESPTPFSAEQLDSRRQAAVQAVARHTREWSDSLGAVRAALALADMLHHTAGNPSAARELLVRAKVQIAAEDGAQLPLANALANTLNGMGLLADAQKVAEAALAKVRPDRPGDRAALLCTLGLIERGRGNYRQALDHFDRLYDASMSVGDAERGGVALHNRAMILATLGRYDEARACYEEELALVQESGDVLAQAQALAGIGHLHLDCDRYGECIEAQERAIALYERLGQDRGVAIALSNIAASLQKQGDLVGAKAIFERILGIYRRIGDRPGEIRTVIDLGANAKDTQDSAAAERHCREGLTLATELGLQAERARATWILAAICRVTDRQTLAQRLYDEALKFYRQNRDRSGEADVLNEIGILQWQAGGLDEAQQTLAEVIRIREALNEPAGVKTAKSNLAVVLLQRGETRRARELLEQVLAMAERLQAQGAVAHAHYNLGELERSQDRWDQALSHFEAALRLYQQLGLVERVVEILATVGQTSGLAGRVGLSLEWFDRAVAAATDADQRAAVSRRLARVLEVLLDNGYGQLAQEYVARLRVLGAQVQFTAG